MGVVHVVGGHHIDPEAIGQPDQGVVAHAVERVAMVPQLGHDVVRTETLDQAGQSVGRRCRAVLGQCPRHRTFTAAGQHDPVVARGTAEFGHPVEPDPGHPLLPRHLGLGYRAGQACIPIGIAGQDHQMFTLGVGTTGPGAGRPQGQLRPEHGRQTVGACRLGEAHHTVEAVVVGEGQTAQPQSHRLLDEFLGVGSAVEEGEVGVAVQLRIGSGHGPHRGRGRWWRLVGGPLSGPGRAVAPIGPGETARPGPGGAPIGESSLDLRPGNARIVEVHRTHVREHLFDGQALSGPRIG